MLNIPSAREIYSSEFAPMNNGTLLKSPFCSDSYIGFVKNAPSCVTSITGNASF